MTTKKKEHRWAILPPSGDDGATSPDDVTQTRRRVPEESQSTQDPALSRRRARTEPELPDLGLPDLNKLAQQVAPSAVVPRRTATGQVKGSGLSSPSREAATVPPDATPTLASPAEQLGGLATPSLIDLTLRSGGQDIAVVERSTTTGPTAPETIPSDAMPAEAMPPATVPPGTTLASPPLGDSGETLPSPPWHDDES